MLIYSYKTQDKLNRVKLLIQITSQLETKTHRILYWWYKVQYSNT